MARQRERPHGKGDDVALGEVARVLGVARSTAWARVIRGDIPARWSGGRFLVRRRDLDQIVARVAQRATDCGQ